MFFATRYSERCDLHGCGVAVGVSQMPYSFYDIGARRFPYSQAGARLHSSAAKTRRLRQAVAPPGQKD